MARLVVLAVVLPLACSDRPQGGSDDETSADAGSSGAPSSPTTGTASADGSTGDGVDGGSSGAPPTSGSTSADGSTGAGGSSGGPGESSTGEDPGGSSGGGGGDGLVLDPASLAAFWLPVDSIRAGVGGLDPDAQACVSVIFFFDGPADALAEHCAFDPMGFWPYVIVDADASPPCAAWDYAGNVEVTSASGCMRVISEDPIEIAIDMVLDVDGAPFTGPIAVKSP